MLLDKFIDEVMSILKSRPDVKEVCVKKVYPLVLCRRRRGEIRTILQAV